jgi:23S rRNA (guanosine2251-2'-O)-methyltransferase
VPAMQVDRRVTRSHVDRRVTMVLLSFSSMILHLLTSGVYFKQNPAVAVYAWSCAARLGRRRSSLLPNAHTSCAIAFSSKRCRNAMRDRVQRDQPFQLFASVSNEDHVSLSNIDFRKNLLREKLLLLGCFDDIDKYEHAVLQSIIDPTSGYDASYGKSAIKTCQTFYYPKTNPSYDSVQWQAAAMRTARQIEFLYKRHVAQETQWIRNHDTATDLTSATMEQPRFPFVLLLDNLRSAENVGSIYRTADATRCQEVMTVGITPHPPGHGKVQKTALGAECLVPTRHFSNATAALDYVKQEYSTYQLIALETTSESIPYTQFPYDVSDRSGIVIILGNEVTGVDVSFYFSNHILDGVLEIPMYGTKNSLNVAVCAPIVIYEIIRQWKK